MKIGMSSVHGFTPPVARSDSPEHAALRKVAGELEAVFVNELFKAMRETVPEGGLVDGGAGEEVFSSLMDQHLSSQAVSGWERGMGAALYRQLRGLVPTGGPPLADPVTNGGEAQ